MTINYLVSLAFRSTEFASRSAVFVVFCVAEIDLAFDERAELEVNAVPSIAGRLHYKVGQTKLFVIREPR